MAVAQLKNTCLMYTKPKVPPPAPHRSRVHEPAIPALGR